MKKNQFSIFITFYPRMFPISLRLPFEQRHAPSLYSFLFKQHSPHISRNTSYPLFPLFFHYIETTLDKFLNFFYLIGISYQVGKLNTSETRQGWNCNSGCEAPQHCTLPRCTNVVFPQTFSGSGTVSKPY